MSSEAEPAPPQRPQEFCVFCGSAIPAHGVYCPRCGAVRVSLREAGVPPAGLRRLPYGYSVYYPSAGRRTPLRQVLKTVSAYIMVSFLIQLVVSVFVLVYGVTIVAPEIMDSWSGFELFLVLPVVVPLVTLSGSTLLAYYYLLIAVIIASCAVFFFKGAKPFAKELTMTAKSREHSVIFATTGLLFATLFFSLVFALLANPSEEDLPDPGTTAEALFLLANASVWEEVIVRVLMIGMPMILIDFARRKWQAKPQSYFIGGGFKLGVPETSLLIASSVIFGVAHYSSGWGAWKIAPATVGGFAFGYLFLKYGIAASVTLHFGTDYLSMPAEISGSLGVAFVTGVGIIVWASFGLIFFVYYVTRVVEFLSGQRLLEGKPSPMPQQYPGVSAWTPVQQHSPQTQHGWQTWPGEGAGNVPASPPPPRRAGAVIGGYVCPRCGNIEARWKDGRFECLRCGFLS